MAEYKYIAKDSQSEEHIGSIQALDASSAASILRKKGLVVISLQSSESGENRFLGKFLNRVSSGELVIITRQLATMVSSGLVLSNAVDILEEQQTNKVLKKVLKDVSEDIKGGLSLAQSLGKHPNVFPHLYTNLIKAGEASGKLDQVLLQMAEGMEKDRQFKSKIQSAMIYPAVVMLMMVIVVIIMMVFVIPKLIVLYTQSSIDLPLPTKILIFTSNLFVYYWWAGLIAIFLIGFSFQRWYKTPEGKYLVGAVLLKIPVIGRLIINVTLTNFSRTFGLLIAAGIPLLEAIGIVSELTDNPVFKKTLKDAYLGVERGLPFSSLLPATVYPKIVSQMVKVGEETGKADEIFFKLADYFETESDTLIKNLTVIIEPVVLVILGIGVGFLVISIILPIYKLTSSF